VRWAWERRDDAWTRSMGELVRGRDADVRFCCGSDAFVDPPGEDRILPTPKAFDDCVMLQPPPVWT